MNAKGIGHAVERFMRSNIAPQTPMEEGWSDGVLGQGNENITDVVQIGIQMRNNDGVTIVKVRTKK